MYGLGFTDECLAILWGLIPANITKAEGGKVGEHSGQKCRTIVGGDLSHSDEVEGVLSCSELGWEVLLGVWGSGLCSFLFVFADSWPEATRFLLHWLSCGDGVLLARASSILLDTFSLDS